MPKRKRGKASDGLGAVGLDPSQGSPEEAIIAGLNAEPDDADGYDKADGIYDFMSRVMEPFEISLDQSRMSLDPESPPGFYKWTRKGWTWFPIDPEPEPDPHEVAYLKWCEEVGIQPQ